MFRFKLHFKLLLAFLVLALVPLAFLAYDSVSNLRSAEQFLTSSTNAALDTQAAEALRLRAETVALSVGDFLREVEGDFWDLSRLPRNTTSWQQFLDGHTREVWSREGTNREWREVRRQRPLYCEAAFVGLDGRERLRLVDGEPVAMLRDVSDPRNTTYKSETYFRRALELAPGELDIGPVTGWYVTRDEQLRGAKNARAAVEGARFEGVIRFAAPLYDAEGARSGFLVLSLDHRHLMEFTLHLTPEKEHFTVFPSYASGNYAFMFDDAGWMIAHPKFWDIRGLDRDGQQVPAYSRETPKERIEAGEVPFNLRHADFIHPNYPVVARDVLAGRSGEVDVTNVCGSQKIMAYAPIFYRGGRYQEGGVFGGITIGAELSQFHQPALTTSQIIREEITRFVQRSTALITLTVVMVFVAAYLLSHGITRPLARLTLGTREMARGKLATRVTVSGHDEVGDLTDSFNAMADELNARRLRLLKTLQALRRSRREILRERNFKQTVVENIEAGLLTLDALRQVTYINGPARQLLGLEESHDPQPLAELLCSWPEIVAALEDAPLLAEQRWSDYVAVERQGHIRTFRLALLPLSARDNQQILSVEDVTERVQMRQQVARMDRLASLGRMAAGIAHEVRNPLTGVNLLLDELHDRLLGQGDDQALIRQALGEIERLEGLVNGLLDFSLPTPTELRPLNVAELLHELLALFRRQCEREKVQLQVDISDNLPRVTGDSGKLKQAFLNLLTNALESMHDGGRLQMRAFAREWSVHVCIQDSGAGISAERLPLIFEPFFTSKDAGSGLGLAITHNIISEYHGRIEVDSRPDEGSRFEVILPVSGEN
ncbi:MAG: histidine kinase [Desulfuromonas sp.]|nr:MAG: histidine kinase [Desulfuromonas sp.]